MQTADFEFILPPDRVAAAPADARDDARLMVMDRRGVARKHLRFRDILDELPRPLAAGAERHAGARGAAARAEADRRRGRIPADAARGATTSGRRATERPICELWEGLDARPRPRSERRLGPAIDVGGGVDASRSSSARDAGRALLRLDGAGAVAARRARRHRRAAAAAVHRGRAQAAGRRPRPRSTIARATRPCTPRARAPSRRRPPACTSRRALLAADRARAGHEIARAHADVGPGTFRPVRGRRSARAPAGRRALPISGRGGRDGDRRARGAERPARRRGRDHGGARAGGVGARERRRGRGRRRRRPICSCCPATASSVVTDLITNFHLPRSTLLMLVAAFAGRETCSPRTARRSRAATASTATATPC